MDTMRFSEAEKREIVHNVKCSVRMESVLERENHGELLIVNDM